MSLKSAIDKLKFDKRMVGINIQTRVVSNQDYKSHLGQLQDEEGKKESVTLDESGTTEEPTPSDY